MKRRAAAAGALSHCSDGSSRVAYGACAVTNSDYYVRHLEASITLAAADSIADGVLAAGIAEGMLPLTAAVLDVGGNLVVVKRADGSGILRVDIAIGKAWGALGMGISSRTIRDRLKDRPAFQSALAAASQGRFVPVPGGVLIRAPGGDVIGAVGVSGDASDRDEYAAIVAVRKAGLDPDPAEPLATWNDAHL
ncbi:heme-binding protein [Phreatobacter aquaticus]|uniref:Heme-binding protein n=1 Tax=Phreatobacter aquaticus TaxID=2570229 RepID=A0A4D7QQK6_9HYPH|nr:heme-binding protein [Phreatobacter aquaticus]